MTTCLPVLLLGYLSRNGKGWTSSVVQFSTLRPVRPTRALGASGLIVQTDQLYQIMFYETHQTIMPRVVSPTWALHSCIGPTRQPN